MMKPTPSSGLLTMALAALAGAAIWHHSSLAGHRTRADEARARLASLNAEIDAAPTSDALDALERLAVLVAAPAIDDAIPAAIGAPHAAVTDVLQRAGLQTRSIATLAPVRHEAITSWPVTIECTGTFSGVLDLARRIDAMPTPIRITRVQITRPHAANLGELSVRIELAMIEIGGGNGTH